MSANIEIGIRIKEYAISKCGSLTEFSKQMGMSIQGIYPYIKGTSLPGAMFLIKMQKLGCDINWLLSGEKSKSEITIESIKKLINDGENNGINNN